MDFQIGDKVRINLMASPAYLGQAGHRGVGTITEHIKRKNGETEKWYWVIFGDNYLNNYPDGALEPIAKPPLMDPDFSLEEIELGNDIYAELNR